MKEKPVDIIFLWIVGILVIVGSLLFLSAALSVLPKNQELFYSMLVSQFGLGLLGGGILCFIISKVPYLFWRKYAFWFFLFSLLITLTVWIPGLGMKHGGATRWLSLGFISFQPSEFLKIAYVIYVAAWASWMKDKLQDYTHGIIPFSIITLFTGITLLIQPDTGTFLVSVAGGIVVYFLAKTSLRDFVIFFLILGLLGTALVLTRPYIKDRVMTFFHQDRDPKGASWQIQQSKMTIGSGQIFGKGYGQSIQKFTYLPEPVGDSIFAVIGEEFGFLGSVIILLLFLAFTLRGIKIALRARDEFGKLVVIGIVFIITTQALLNIASSLGLFPFTGLPLSFVSHGGTSLLITGVAIGIILNVSRYQKKYV
jgi:cell division protein FtsW